MRHRTEVIVRRLAELAEEACRRYLFNGRKIGNYWVVGDRRNAMGRSLYVRLKGPSRGTGAAGKWTDAATGEHGDLLDIIATAIGSDRHEDALGEAEKFLGMAPAPSKASTIRGDTSHAAGRLFAAGKPLDETLAADYLLTRGIDARVAGDALRFHHRCYRVSDAHKRQQLPAMLAAVTDNAGGVTGLMRTYLSADGSQKAPIDAPRRAMGALAGNGVRFGPPADVMAVGEGIETILSLRMAMPAMSMIAALSATHLGALIAPSVLRRLYIAVDRDAAGRAAAERLTDRLQSQSIEAIELTPQLKDFNDDLIAAGPAMLAAHLGDQLTADDRARYLRSLSRAKAG